MVKLTARIRNATDGKLVLTVDEAPGLVTQVHNLSDIPDAIRKAASGFLGLPAEEIEVKVGY
ncbi:hypothetical protein [Arthrobacter sp. ISL-30]|uniref:hypothetical protein n=1 Tax=Arthrobacter sp. ISL-30 TaxID=2819109 RepID=UPI001BE5C06F|nr:hypothetical protein [Arthrobacter sp. ISL-30]MBT2511980.1 hypothetical protein [Arthrobacter sp. ISL-30]